MSVNDAERARVYATIAPLVLEFANARAGQEFHVEDLRRHVLQHVVVAPNSPYRIMYELQREKKLSYTVVNRRQSLYRFGAVGAEPKAMTTKLDHAFLDRFAAIGAKVGEEFGPPPARKLALLIRPSIVARSGKVYVWGDWSSIEAVTLPWLADSPLAEAKLDIYRENFRDRTRPDVYMVAASELLEKDPADVTKEERQSHGKVTELSLCYGGAEGALAAMAANYRVYIPPHLQTQMVQKWRANNQWAVDFWGVHNKNESYGLWGAACSAVANPDDIYTAGRIAYVFDKSYMGGSLFCSLPCGRLLTYPAIKWEWREVVDKKTGKTEERYQLTYRKQYGRTAMWRGKCAENVAQAVATGSVLRQTLVRLDTRQTLDCPDSDKLCDWMPVVGHTHDEIVTETLPGDAEGAAGFLHDTMVEGFDWAPGLPLNCEITTNWYYTKAKVK